jgi:DASH complex subunit Ask1
MRSIASVLISSSLSLLQNIDADFSRMQQVLSNRILPAFKRYSIGTEPAREAAKVYACVHSTYSCHDTFSSSGHPFMSRLPRSAYQLPMTYRLCRRPHLVWPWRMNPTRPLTLKICPLHRDLMLIRSTQIVHHPKVPSSPHKPQSPPHQQQRLHGHGEQMTPH